MLRSLLRSQWNVRYDVTAYCRDQPEGNVMYAFCDDFFGKGRGIITVVQIDEATPSLTIPDAPHRKRALRCQ